MGNNQENVEVTDGETGEVFSVNVNSIVCDVRDRMLARRKMQTEATVWPKLPELKQREEITEAHNAAFDIVRAVTELVATRGVELIHAQFKSAAIDDKCNIKIMLAGRTDDEQLVALNRVGSKVLKIMVLDHEQFNAERNEIKPDADQPEMGFDEYEKPEAPVEGAIADQLREAGYDVKEDADGNQEIEAPADAEPDQTETQEAMAVEEDQAPDEPEVASEPEGENVKMSDEDAAAQEAEAVAATEEAGEVSDDHDDAGEAEVADPYEAGQEARASGQGPDDNPFDGGTEGFNAWAEGYTDADGEIAQLVQQGYDARKDGQPDSKNPWKAKSRENGWWAEGYAKAEAEGLPEE